MTKNQKATPKTAPKAPKTAPKTEIPTTETNAQAETLNLADMIREEAANAEAKAAETETLKLTIDTDERKELEAAGEVILSAKMVAMQLGVSAYEFRSFLRELGGYDDKKYTKYGFVQGGPELARVLTIWAEYQTRKAEDAAKKAAAKAAAAPAPEAE